GSYPRPLLHPLPYILTRRAPVAELERKPPDMAAVPGEGKKSRPPLRRPQKSLHYRILRPQQLLIPVCKVFRPRHKNTAVSPSGCRHDRPHIAGARHHHRNADHASLLCPHIDEPLVQEAAEVELIASRSRKHG